MAERYEIKGKIARGGIGAIYRAYDNVMGRDVALKRLLPIEQTHLNEAADESLKREAAALARFQHPNVVSIFAFEEDEDGPYVVMELVEGETLKDLVEHAALPVEDFIELVQQVLDPLIAAKDLNLLHRDIKPSNIMLSWLPSGKFQIKVLDFGLSKFSQAPSTQTLDQTGSFLGSIDYLAPEQLDLKKLDQRTDLYSLGCVLYFCLTQQPPFEGGNAAKTMRNHLTHEVTHLSELRPDVPQTIADWLMRMISRYPNQRPDDAKAALIEFMGAKDGKSSDSEVESETIPVAIPVVEEAVAPIEKTAPAQKGRDRPKSPGSQTQLLMGTPKNRTQPQLIVPKTGEDEPAPRRKLGTPFPGKKASPTNRTSSSARGTAGSGNRTISPRTDEKKRFGKKRLVAIGLILIAGAIIAFLVTGSRSDEDSFPPDDNGQVSPSTRGKSKGYSTPPPPMPTMENPSPRPKGAAAPSIKDGLAAHYSAAAGVFGPDFRSAAKPGERVSWWSNLAGGAASVHLLAVDARHQERGPKLMKVAPGEVSELAAEVPVLEFERSTRLSSRGQKQITKLLSGTSMTSIVVMRPSVDRAGVLRFETPGMGGVINWDLTPAGYAFKMAKGSLRPGMEAKIGALRDRFLVLTHVWNGEKVEQLLYLTLPGGRHVLAAAGDAPFKPTPVQRYSIGGIANENQDQTFAGQVAEWLVFDRALTNEEREKVAGQLAKKYFKADLKLTVDFVSPMTNGQKPPPRNAEVNATTVAPKLPISDSLVAHYSASDFAFGSDLRHEANPGERVMAWANLAPDTNADHLLAYQNGKEAATPLLEEVTQADFPELNGPQRVLFFSEGDTLEAKGTGQIQSKMDDKEFTCIAVMQTNEIQVPVIRLKSPSVNPAAAISFQPKGWAGMIRQGNQWKLTGPAAAPEGGFAIVSLTWKAEAGQHRVHVRLPDGTNTVSSPVKSHYKSLKIDAYRIGKAKDGKGAKKAPREFSGRIAELILYGTALSDRDREEIEEHLHQRYFDK